MSKQTQTKQQTRHLLSLTFIHSFTSEKVEIKSILNLIFKVVDAHMIITNLYFCDQRAIFVFSVNMKQTSVDMFCCVEIQILDLFI